MPFGKWTILLLILAKFFSAQSFAAPFSVIVSNAGIITLTARDCQATQLDLDALRAWTQRVGEKTSNPPPLLPTNEGCSVALTGSVPSFVQKHEDQHPVLDGPNCWNTALVVDKILSTVRNTESKEFTFWMNSPLCRPLATGDLPQPGDIIAIRSHSESPTPEVHGMIYVNKDMVFSKNSVATSEPYALQVLDDVLSSFAIATSDTSCRTVAGDAARKCMFFTQYFRCSTLTEYTKDHDEYGLENYLAAVSTSLTPIELEIEGFVMSAGAPAQGTSDRIQNQLASLQALSDSELQTVEPSNSTLRFLWQSVQAQIASLQVWRGPFQ